MKLYTYLDYPITKEYNQIHNIKLKASGSVCNDTTLEEVAIYLVSLGGLGNIFSSRRLVSKVHVYDVICLTC